MLARLFSPYSSFAEELPVSLLVRKLQSALSSLENFPVILSHSSKQRNWFAAVPNGRCMPHPCLRVRFVRGEGEMCLSDYSNDAVTVDPFSSLDSIEGFLLPKVRIERTKQIETAALAMDPMESVQLQSNVNPGAGRGESSDHMEPDSTSTDLTEIQVIIHESIVLPFSNTPLAPFPLIHYAVVKALRWCVFFLFLFAFF